MALTIYHVTLLSQNLLPSLSVRYARRLDPLKCVFCDRLQAAVILIKGLLSKYAKLIILFTYLPSGLVPICLNTV